MHLDKPFKDLFIYYIEGRLKSSVSINQDGFIGNWEEDGYSFLFYEKPSLDKVEALLDKETHLKLIDDYEMTWEDWLGGKVKAFSAGCFHIVPPWEKDAVIENDRHILYLHPGVVFGTGTHPTTSDCLRAVEWAAKVSLIKTAVDLGAGTGILSLAAAKLGISKVLAVDLNLLAVKTAKINIDINRLERNVIAVQGDALTFISHEADLLIANIHYDIMKRLVADEGFLAKKIFILSGLLRSEAKIVIGMLKSMPVAIDDIRETDGVWYTISGRVNGFITQFP